MPTGDFCAALTLAFALGCSAAAKLGAAEGAKPRTTMLMQEQPRQMPTMLKYQGPVDCGIEPQACARKPFQVHAHTRYCRASRGTAQGVSAHREWRLSPCCCSVVVSRTPPTVHSATPLRPCELIRVPDPVWPAAAYSSALPPLPRDAWCMARGSLAFCRPTRRRRIPSCSECPRTFSWRSPMRMYIVRVVATAVTVEEKNQSA